jgi:WD40 repeat protein
MDTMAPGARDLVFVSYSHADPSSCRRLLLLLKPFVRQGALRVWADPDIEAGDDWQRQIDVALDRARVGVVLLNPDYLASDFIAAVELPRLLVAARAGHLRLIVVPVDHVPVGATSFPEGDLADYQWCGGSPDAPLSSLEADRRNKALVDITDTIVKAMGPRQNLLDVPPAVPRPADAAVTTAVRMGELHWLPEAPAHFVPRTREHDRLKAALRGRAAIVGVSGHAQRVGIHGQGGIGKTVLAWGVAHDRDVRLAFPDGIFWLTLGETPNLAALQARLARALDDSTTATVGDTKALRERLKNRSCLVILDDVWAPAHVSAFDVLTGASRLLVTTRDSSVLTTIGAEELSVDALSPAAALDLLGQWAGVSPVSLPAEAASVAAAVGYLPLALSLIGALVREGRSWSQTLDALRRGDHEFRDHPYANILKAVRANVDALNPFEVARYFELAIFPDDVEIPVDDIALLWRRTGGMDASATERLLSRFDSRGLIRLAIDARFVTMHDLQRDFSRLTIDDLRAVHRQFVDALRETLGGEAADRNDPDRWATLPSTDAYAWDFLGYHLAQAGRRQELEGLLTSAAWLRARLERSSIATVVRDYEQELVDPPLREIGRALVLSAHVLTRSPEQLHGQLAGRLQHVHDARVRRLIDARPSQPDIAWFRPVSTCLTPPGRALIRTLEGHRSDVWGIAVFANGRRALSGAGDGSLCVWDLETGEIIRTLAAHARLRGVVGLTDDRRALTTYLDGSMRVWNLDDGALLHTLKGHTGCARTVVMLPDGRRALSASIDGTLKLWNLDDGVLLHTFENNYTVALHPDGRHALSASHDATLTLWDLDERAVRRVLEGHTNRVNDIAIHPDGSRALSASNDGTVKLWDLGQTTPQHTFDHAGDVTTVCIMPDGRRAFSIAGKMLKVWDIVEHRLLRTLDGIFTAVLLPDGQHVLATSLSDDSIRVCDLASGAVLKILEGHTDSVWVLAPLPDGRRALSAAWDQTLKLWDLTVASTHSLTAGHGSRVSALLVLPDGKRVLSGSSDQTLKLWEVTTGDVVKSFSMPAWAARAVALLRNGREVLVATDDGTLMIWDVEAGAVVRTLRARMPGVNAIASLPDGRRVLLACEDRKVKLFDLETETIDHVFEGHTAPVNDVLLTPDRGRVVTASNDWTLRLWEVQTPTPIRTFRGHTGAVSAVRLLSNAAHIVSASDDRTLRTWDLESGDTLRTFEGHTRWIYALAVLPGLDYFVSASGDRTLKLWDPLRSSAIATFDGDAPYDVCAAVTHDCIVAGDRRGRVHTFRIEADRARLAAS